MDKDSTAETTGLKVGDCVLEVSQICTELIINFILIENKYLFKFLCCISQIMREASNYFIKCITSSIHCTKEKEVCS